MVRISSEYSCIIHVSYLCNVHFKASALYSNSWCSNLATLLLSPGISKFLFSFSGGWNCTDDTPKLSKDKKCWGCRGSKTHFKFKSLNCEVWTMATVGVLAYQKIAGVNSCVSAHHMITPNLAAGHSTQSALPLQGVHPSLTPLQHWNGLNSMWWIGQGSFIDTMVSFDAEVFAGCWDTLPLTNHDLEDIARLDATSWDWKWRQRVFKS